MSNDLKTIFVRDIVPVRFADFVLETRTLVLIGEDFRSAFAVLINGSEVTNFTVVNATTIELVLPEDLRDQRIRTIDVYSEAFTSTVTSFLEPRVGLFPQWTSGLHKLVQQYSKLLLTNPGSNLFRKEEGGGIRRLAGAPVSDLAGSNVVAQVMNSAKAVATQIKRSQAGRALPNNERLRSATVMDVRYTAQTTGLQAKIRIENEADQLAVTNMGIGNTPVEPLAA